MHRAPGRDRYYRDWTSTRRLVHASEASRRSNPTLPADQQVRRRDDEHRQEGSGDHPADHGRGDAAHDLGAGAAAPHDRQKPGDDHGHGHGNRADPERRALDNPFDELAPVIELSIRRPGAYRLIDIDQHHNADLRSDAAQRDEAYGGRDRHVVAEQIHQPKSAGQGEGQRRHDQQRIGETAENQIEQDKNNHQRRRHHELQLLGCPLQELELPRPRDRVAGRQFDLLRNGALHLADRRAQVAPMQIDVDPPREPGIFALQHRRAVADADSRYVAQAYLCAALGQHREIANHLDRVPDFARVADIDREALQTLDRLADVVAPDRRRDHALYVRHIQAIASRGATVDLHIDVASPRQPFRKCGGNARNLLHHALDLGRDAIDLLQLGAGHFDPHGTLDTRGQHVDAVANRWYPDVGKPRHLDRAIELLVQLVRCHPGPPPLTRFELDRV